MSQKNESLNKDWISILQSVDRDVELCDIYPTYNVLQFITDTYCLFAITNAVLISN